MRVNFHLTPVDGKKDFQREQVSASHHRRTPGPRRRRHRPVETAVDPGECARHARGRIRPSSGRMEGRRGIGLVGARHRRGARRFGLRACGIGDCAGGPRSGVESGTVSADGGRLGGDRPVRVRFASRPATSGPGRRHNGRRARFVRQCGRRLGSGCHRGKPSGSRCARRRCAGARRG